MKLKNTLILILVFFLFSIVIVSGQTEPKIYYKLSLRYDNGNITLKSIDIDLSNKEINDNLGAYHVSLLNSNKKVVNITLFDIPNKILIDSQDSNWEINGGGEIELNKIEFELYVPYDENVKEMVVYNPNLKELARKDVSMYSKNNSLTNKDAKINEKNNRKDENNANKINVIKNYWLLLIILIISVIIIIYILKRKNKKQR